MFGILIISQIGQETLRGASLKFLFHSELRKKRISKTSGAKAHASQVGVVFKIPEVYVA